MHARKVIFGLLSCYISTNVWLLRLSRKDNFLLFSTSQSHAVHRTLRKGIIPSLLDDHSHYQQPWEPFGQVMRQLSRRVLSRNITCSNILVVSGDANIDAATAQAATGNNTYHSDSSTNFRSVGERFLLDGIREGHAAHTITTKGRTLDEWWSSFEPHSSTEKPAWILLAVFDTPLWMEDVVWSKSSQFLEEATVTYIVHAFHSFRETDGTYRFGGLEAAERLLQRRYKIQSLSVSHYHAEANNAKETFERYGPNALFQSVSSIKDFLRWGADSAKMYDASNRIFTAFVFATQGLDLAIPSSQIYLTDSHASINPMETIHKKDFVSFKQCPSSNDQKLKLHFKDESLIVKQQQSDGSNQVFQFSDEGEHPPETDYQFWMDGNTPSMSEAACVRKRMTGESKCTTRILKTSRRSMPQNAIVSNRHKPNILLILLDPISRAHFDRVMPHSKEALQLLNFTSFTNYTAVGPNSGPNQAALYAGALLTGRNGIRSDSSGKTWLWEQLSSHGYITMKGEDGCIENSNMLQSLSPNTTHGSALQGLFCFDSFSRPNCIGPDAAAAILLSYAEQFILAYEEERRTMGSELRWASFLHFTDSHEDTMILAATIDQIIASFLNKMNKIGVFDETIVVVCSDHGLHYGPGFSTLLGKIEATQPILHIRIPEILKEKVNLSILRQNSQKVTTPFDVHETILQLADISHKFPRRLGESLTTDLKLRDSCNKVQTIPQSYCDLQKNTEATKALPIDPPTLDAFFHDSIDIYKKQAH